MLRQRLITVAIMLPLFLAALFLLPNVYWGVLLMTVAVIGGWEWGRLAHYPLVLRVFYCVLLTLTCIAILVWEHGAFGAQIATGDTRWFIHTSLGKALFAAAAVFWLALAPLWLYRRWQLRNGWLLGIVGWIILISFWQAMVWLQNAPLMLFLSLGVVWLADTAAYFAGRRFGKHKLAPAISPGKTREGVYGAFVVVTLYWIVLAVIAPAKDPRLVIVLGCMLLMTVLSVVGDLFESWMKRVAGVKDSGGLLPGHGGMLDRIDGLCSAIPLAALYFAYASSGI